VPTLRELIASLPPEEQAAMTDKILRATAYRTRVTAHPVLGRVEAVAEGIGAGLGNAAKGLVTSPLALTNALGLTDFEAPKKPLIGPGGDFASDPALGLGVGPFYGTGNVAGFAASFLGGAGEAKVGASLLTRAATGAARLAAGVALRSQGTLEDRLVAGIETAPFGAGMSLIGPRAAGESLGKYIFKSSLKAGVVGAVTPGGSPVEATGIPAVDNALFNAAFHAAANVRAKEPKVPGRENAQAIDRAPAEANAALLARAGDMNRTMEEQATLEGAIATQHPLQPTSAAGGLNLFGEVQGTERSLFEGLPTEERRAGLVSGTDAVKGTDAFNTPEAPPADPRYENTPFGPALKTEFTSQPRISGPLTETRPEDIFSTEPTPTAQQEERGPNPLSVNEIRMLRPEGKSAAELESHGLPPLPVGSLVQVRLQLDKPIPPRTDAETQKRLANMDQEMRAEMGPRAAEYWARNSGTQEVTEQNRRIGVIRSNTSGVQDTDEVYAPNAVFKSGRYYHVQLLSDVQLTALKRGILPHDLIDQATQAHTEYSNARDQLHQTAIDNLAAQGNTSPTKADIQNNIDEQLRKYAQDRLNAVVKYHEEGHNEGKEDLTGEAIQDHPGLYLPGSFLSHPSDAHPGEGIGGRAHSSNIFLIKGSDLGIPVRERVPVGPEHKSILEKLWHGQFGDTVAKIGKLTGELPDRARADRASIEDQVLTELAATPTDLWGDGPVHIIIAAPTGTYPYAASSHALASVNPLTRTITLYPSYFVNPDRAGAISDLVHEGLHIPSLLRGLADADPGHIASLFRKLNYPVAVDRASFGGADQVHQSLADQIFHFIKGSEGRTGRAIVTYDTLNKKTSYIAEGMLNDGTIARVPFSITSLRHQINLHRDNTNKVPRTTEDVYFALTDYSTLYRLATADRLLIPPIADRHYAYTSPGEMISELGAALAYGNSLRSLDPAALELLDAMPGGREAAFIQGVSRHDNLRTQNSLFPSTFPPRTLQEPGPLGGPKDISISWLTIPEARKLDNSTLATQRSETENDHPFSFFAVQLSGTGARGGVRTNAQHAAENVSSNYTFRLGLKGTAQKLGALSEIASRIHDLILNRSQEADRLNPPVVEGEPGSQRKSVVLKDLEYLIKFSDAKPIIDEEIANAKKRVSISSPDPDDTRSIEDLPDTGEIDYTKLFTGVDSKITRAVTNTDYTTQFHERLDAVKDARLKSLSFDGRLSLLANRDLDKTMKFILLKRYPALFKHPDGSVDKVMSIGAIARHLNITERTIRKRLQDFSGVLPNEGPTGTRKPGGKSDSRLLARTIGGIDLKQPELFPGETPLVSSIPNPDPLPGPPNNLVRGGEVIPTDDPSYDYIVWKNKTVLYNRETGKVEASSVRSRRGTGRAVITDLRTGQREVQAGLFDDRRAAYAEAERESRVPEEAAAHPPTPLTQQETAMDAALGEASSGPLATTIIKGAEAATTRARRGGVKPTIPELASLFGNIKGAIVPTSRLGEITTFEEARANIGNPKMSDAQFASLHIDQQLRHVILRLTSAANTLVYARTLAKYDRFLNGHLNKKTNIFYPTVTEAGIRVPFPTLSALVNASTGVKKVAPRVAWMGVLNARAAELGVRIEQVNPERGTAAKLRLTEPETGRTITTHDVGTAALFLDARSRRLLDAIDLMPPGFSHIRIYLDPAGGPPFGPPPVADTPTALDAEPSGRPPDMPSGAERSYGDAFFVMVRPTLNVAASLARKLNYPEIALAVRNLMEQLETGRNQAQRTIQHRIDLAKKWHISNARAAIRGAAAADVDLAGEAVLKSTGDLAQAIAHIDTVQDAIYAAHGLQDNEISYLKEMRPQWDRMFRLFDIGVTKYIPGYFTRWRRNDPENGTVVLDATHTTNVDFFARMYRKGHLRGQEYHYEKVFDHYARQGFREKHVGTSPGSGILSPIERVNSVLQRYKLVHTATGSVPWVDIRDEMGTATGRIAKQFDPLVRLIDVARGIPDSRRLNAIEAQAGITKRLYDATDEKLNATIDRAYVPFRKELKAVTKSIHEALGVKLSEPSYNTWLDLYTRLSRARTFGLSFGKALRNSITDGLFATLPRVGPKYYAQAVSDLLHPTKGPQIYRRAAANNVIKPAFVTEYISTTNKALTHIEKLSFMFSLSDHWGRAVAFRAQELKTRDAALAYTAHGDIEKFKHDSGLTLLDPAWHGLVTEPLLRGNAPVAIREHAKLLADIALFDYTNANAPIAFRGMWGRFLGQYSIWPINTIESFAGMVRWGTREERLKQAALYAASAAAVYGAGAAIGVKTAQWIPFVHSVVYTGAPGFGLGEEVREALAGDPQTQQRLLSDLQHDPTTFFLGGVTKNILPGGDTLRVLAAQTNMSRRRRRLLGIPRPEPSTANRAKRLLGFVPATAPPPKSGPLVQRLLEKATEKLP